MKCFIYLSFDISYVHIMCHNDIESKTLHGFQEERNETKRNETKRNETKPTVYI